MWRQAVHRFIFNVIIAGELVHDTNENKVTSVLKRFRSQYPPP